MELEYNEIYINDFTHNQIHPLRLNDYYLNKSCIIFNKLFTKNILKINVYGNNELFENNIYKINVFLNWIGNKCKNELIRSYCEIISSLDFDIYFTEEDLNNSRWYEELEILDVEISLSEKDVLSCRIYCSEINNKNKVLYILFHEYFVYSIEYMNINTFECLQNISKIIRNNESIKDLESNNLYETENIKKEKIKNKNICSIHNCIMKKMKIEKYLHAQFAGGIYGYREAKSQLFFNCDDKIEIFDFDENNNELTYVCKLCNKAREKWVNEHRSHISFQLNINICENIIITLNNEIKLLLKKTYKPFENYWINNISLANGTYNIIALNKKTNEILLNASI